MASDGGPSLARLFRQTRVELGFDLATLAAEAEVSVESVAKLETRPEMVPLSELYAVANVLNLDPGVVLECLHSIART